jgi:hypothetical protein
VANLVTLPQDEHSTGTTGVSSKAVTLPLSVLAGSLILVAGAVWRASDPAPITVADDLGTTYTVVAGSTISWSSGLSRGFIAYGIAPSAGVPTITVTPSGSSSFITFWATEVFDPSATPLDVNGGESTGTGTSPSDDITPTEANAVVIGLVSSSSPGSQTGFAPGAGIAPLFTDISNLNAPFAVAMKRVPTPTTVTFAWTLGTSRTWSVLTLAFK